MCHVSAADCPAYVDFVQAIETLLGQMLPMRAILNLRESEARAQQPRGMRMILEQQQSDPLLGSSAVAPDLQPVAVQAAGQQTLYARPQSLESAEAVSDREEGARDPTGRAYLSLQRGGSALAGVLGRQGGRALVASAAAAGGGRGLHRPVAATTTAQGRGGRMGGSTSASLDTLNAMRQTVEVAASSSMQAQGVTPTAAVPSVAVTGGPKETRQDVDHKALGASLRFVDQQEEVVYCAFAAEQWQRGLDLLVLLFVLGYLSATHLAHINTAQKQFRAVLMLLGPPALLLGLRGLQSVPLQSYAKGRELVLVVLRLLGVVYACWGPAGKVLSIGVFRIDSSVLALLFQSLGAMVRLHIHVPLQLLSCCVVVGWVLGRAIPATPRAVAQSSIQHFLCGFVIPTLFAAAVEWQSRLTFLRKKATANKQD